MEQEENMRAGAAQASLRARAHRAMRDPVVGILTLAGIFDWISGNPIHSVLLFGAGAAVAWGPGRGLDAAGVGREAPTRPLDLPRTKLFLAVAVLYAVFMGGFPRYSWPLTTAVVVPAAIALALASSGSLRRPPVPPPVDRAGAIAWLSVFVALAIWELAALLLQPSLTTDSYAHPTISVMTDPFLASHPGRSVALFGWLAFGWFLSRS